MIEVIIHVLVSAVFYPPLTLFAFTCLMGLCVVEIQPINDSLILCFCEVNRAMTMMLWELYAFWGGGIPICSGEPLYMMFHNGKLNCAPLTVLECCWPVANLLFVQYWNKEEVIKICTQF